MFFFPLLLVGWVPFLYVSQDGDGGGYGAHCLSPSTACFLTGVRSSPVPHDAPLGSACLGRAPVGGIEGGADRWITCWSRGKLGRWGREWCGESGGVGGGGCVVMYRG